MKVIVKVIILRSIRANININIIQFLLKVKLISVSHIFLWQHILHFKIRLYKPNFFIKMYFSNHSLSNLHLNFIENLNSRIKYSASNHFSKQLQFIWRGIKCLYFIIIWYFKGLNFLITHYPINCSGHIQFNFIFCFFCLVLYIINIGNTSVIMNSSLNKNS